MSPPTLDPVCGQTIDPVRARAVAIYGPTVFYFCCREHKERFQSEPTKFLAADSSTQPVSEELLERAPPGEPTEDSAPSKAPEPELHLVSEPAAAAPELSATVVEAEVDLALAQLLAPESRPEPATLELRFEIGGMAEKADAERVRRAIEKVLGVHAVAIDLLTEVATVEAVEGLLPARLVEAISQAGFEASWRRKPVREDQAALAARAKNARRRATVGVGLAVFGALLLGGSVRAPLWHTLLGAMAVFGPGAFLLGMRGGRGADARRLDAMPLGILALLVLSVWQVFHDAQTFPHGVTVTVLSALALVARFIEERALASAAAALLGVERVLPTHACRVKKGAPAERVPVQALASGELLRVSSGEVVPADGVIRVGEGTVDESFLSAERVAVLRAPGDAVMAGTELISGTLIIEVRRAAQETVVARLYAALRETQSSEGALGRLARLCAARMGPVSLGLALVAVGVHAGILGKDLVSAAPIFAAVLCAACPAALALSTQVALALATARAADRGILFRHAEAMERAYEVAWLAAGKNGTLTVGRPRIMAHTVTPGTDEGRLLALASAAERAAETPLGRAVRAYASDKQLPAPPAERAAYAPGLGVTAVVAGTSVVVGSQRLLEREGISLYDAVGLVAPDWAPGTSVLYVALGGQLAGALAVADPLREEARDFVSGLSRRGLRLVLVTGDDPAAAQAVAERTGIKEVHAALRPDEKKHTVVALRRPGLAVAALGDGGDDAPILAAADVGIVLGGGAEPALEAGSITVLRGQLGDVVAALALARRTVGIMRQNVACALGISVLSPALFALLPMGASGPLYAAGLSTVALAVVVGNSLRVPS